MDHKPSIYVYKKKDSDIIFRVQDPILPTLYDNKMNLVTHDSW